MLAANDIFMGSAAIFMLLIPSIWFAKRVAMVPPAAPAATGRRSERTTLLLARR
jgi:hypothetical protein